MTTQQKIQALNDAASDREGLKVPGTSDAPGDFGCTDTLAANYNASATIDDGSCVYNADPNQNE